MVSLEVLAILLSGISISASLFYYATVLKNQNETRQAQLFNSVFESMMTTGPFSDAWELLLDWQYDNFEDFMEKYGPETNREAFIKFNRYMTQFERMGIYIKRNLISAELIDDFMSGNIINLWDKFGPFIEEFRAYRNNPAAYEHVEYLYNQIKPIRDTQHPQLEQA